MLLSVLDMAVTSARAGTPTLMPSPHPPAIARGDGAGAGGGDGGGGGDGLDASSSLTCRPHYHSPPPPSHPHPRLHPNISIIVAVVVTILLWSSSPSCCGRGHRLVLLAVSAIVSIETTQSRLLIYWRRPIVECRCRQLKVERRAVVGHLTVVMVGRRESVGPIAKTLLNGGGKKCLDGGG
ncbi:hypothetical protein BDZ89DRAFT_830317 [Hymenopellis radicata]|nr:hypothetical protein BDZ89DRAFT_830317 [Hymenopellis radicata]